VNDWLLVHNTASRRGKLTLRRVQAALERPEWAAWRGIRSLPLRDLTSVREAPERVIVLGGDGSINAAAEWLVGRGASAPLAILPAGTGNNLARGLGIPLGTEDALGVALRGSRARPLDAIAYRGREDRERLIVQTSALGFPAEIAWRYDALRRHSLFRLLAAPAGPYVYRVLALLGLRDQKRRERRGDVPGIRCAMPGETIEERAFAVFIGNERSLGGNFIPCPRAEVDDGKLDLCLVRAGTGASYLDLFRRIARGEHLALERTVVYRQTAGPVEIQLSKPAPLLADGDLWVTSDRFTLRVLERRFQAITG
jgi:diacylglycerol kinase (ATP)